MVVFKTFFEIGSAIALSLVFFGVLPALLLFRKFGR